MLTKDDLKTQLDFFTGTGQRIRSYPIDPVDTIKWWGEIYIQLLTSHLELYNQLEKVEAVNLDG